MAQKWMAEVRRGGNPSAAKAAARSVPTVKELCGKFIVSTCRDGKATHLLSDEYIGKLFRHLEHMEVEGREQCTVPLAIRLQFEFAARRPESSRSKGNGSIGQPPRRLAR